MVQNIWERIIMTTDTVTISDISLDNILDDTVTYTDLSGCTPTMTIDTSTISSPTYTGSTITLDDGVVYIDTKRKKLRDEGELPIDIWAKMYNNGVIDDD
jgi:hypothetical protein